MSGRNGAGKVKKTSLNVKKSRAARFQSGSNEPSTYVDIRLGTVRGSSTALEKPYFRLTGQVNPAVVRPPEVLQNSLHFVLTKYAGGESYTYIREQLQSIRQDLTVQHVESELTSRVYEVNVLLALANDDLSEFHRCLSRVLAMGASPEFRALHVLYMLLLKKWGDVEAEVERGVDAGGEAEASANAEAGAENEEEEVRTEVDAHELAAQLANGFRTPKLHGRQMLCRALRLAECVLEKDIFAAERVASNSRFLERKLVLHVLERMRLAALAEVLTALGGQQIPLRELARTAGVSSRSEMLGSGGTVVCSDLLPVVTARLRALEKIDF